jgi:hypothetical protein
MVLFAKGLFQHKHDNSLRVIAADQSAAAAI